MNGLFVALASRSSSPRIAKLTSLDGRTWVTNSPGTAELNEFKFTSIAFGNDRFVALGDSFAATRGVGSVFGTNWDYTIGLPEGPIAFGNGLFVNAWLFDIKSTGTTLIANTSVDGFSWMAQGYSGSAAYPYGLCFGGGKFLAVGQALLGQGAYTASSPDGTNWLTQTVVPDASL